jgi:hypothetical protein
MSSQTRVRAGIPTGGQYANHDRAEALVGLLPENFPTETAWLDDNNLMLPPLAIAEFDARLAKLGRPANVFDYIATYEKVHTDVLGYSANDIHSYNDSVQLLEAAGRIDQANGLRRLVEALMERQPMPMPLQNTETPTAPAADSARNTAAVEQTPTAQPSPYDEDEAARQRNENLTQRPIDDPANILALNLPTPISIDDARIKNGQLFDTIISTGENGQPIRFERTRKGYEPQNPNYIRIQFDQPQNPTHTAELAKYALNTAHKGAAGQPIHDTPHSIIIPITLNKNRDTTRDIERFQQLHTHIPQLLTEGSETRKTNRSGANTAGTKAIKPIDAPVRFAIFYG